MSKIRVWTSAGEWSEAITGLDKVDLIKAVVLREYCPNYDEEYELPGLEIDGENISSEDFDAEDYEGNINEFWRKFEGKRKLHISDVKTITARLSTFREMAAHPYLSAAYNAIITAACVPTHASAGYCLLLKFE